MFFPNKMTNHQRSRQTGATDLRPGLLVAAVVALAACTPTVKVATDEPITINLNVNIKHEIRVAVDNQLESLFENDDLF